MGDVLDGTLATLRANQPYQTKKINNYAAERSG